MLILQPFFKSNFMRTMNLVSKQRPYRNKATVYGLKSSMGEVFKTTNSLNSTYVFSYRTNGLSIFMEMGTVWRTLPLVKGKL